MSDPQTTPGQEEAEAQKLFNEVLPDLKKENADKLIQHIAAGALIGGLQIGVALRLMKKVTEWQMENAAPIIMEGK